AWERDEYWATTILLGTAYTARETRPGWTIGIGGEYAFTNVLSGFVEYNYYDLGTRQIALTPQVVGLGPAFVDINETKSVVRAGLNVRFGGSAAPGPNYSAREGLVEPISYATACLARRGASAVAGQLTPCGTKGS